MIKDMDRPWFKLSLASILLLAVCLRFFKLGELPVSLYWDEVAILADAKVVSQTGTDLHSQTWFQALFASYGDYKLPVYIWLSSLAVKFGGVNAWSVRLTSALAGIMTVWLAGLIAQQLVSNSKRGLQQLTRLGTMLVVAISPWPLLFSRTAFEGHLAQFFVALSLYLAIISAKNKSWLKLTGSVLAGAAATYTYFSVRFVWPPIFVIISILKLSSIFQTSTSNSTKSIKTNKAKQTQFEWLKFISLKILLPLTAYFLLLWPMFKSPLYEASQTLRYSTDSLLTIKEQVLKQNQFRQLAGNSLFDRILFHRHWFWLKDLAENVSDHLSLNYLFLAGDSNLRHGTGEHGLFLLIFLPFFLIGLYQFYRQNKINFFILIGWWLFALPPASIPQTTPHALRSLNALVPLSVIIGFGLAVTGQKISNLKTKFLKIFLTSVLLLMIFLSSSAFIYHYFVQYGRDSSSSFQDSYAQLAKNITQKYEEVDEIRVTDFDYRFFLWLWLETKFSAEEIQAMEKIEYKPNQIGKIFLSVEEPTQELELKTKSYLLVGPKNQLKDDLKQAIKENRLEATDIKAEEIVSSSDQKLEYLLVIMHNNDS